MTLWFPPQHFASSKLGRPHHFSNPTLTPTQIVLSSPNVLASWARTIYIYIYFIYLLLLLFFKKILNASIWRLVTWPLLQFFATIVSYCTSGCMGFVKKKFPYMCDLLIIIVNWRRSNALEVKHVNKKNFSQKIEQWSNHMRLVWREH